MVLFWPFGAEDGNRTRDPSLTKTVLCRLSYLGGKNILAKVFQKRNKEKNWQFKSKKDKIKKMEREGGENRGLTRRKFLELVGATAAATAVATYLEGKNLRVIISILKECLPFSEDPRWEWARKIVAESRFRVEGKEGLEPTAIAVNQFLRKVYGLEEKPVPFAVFEEEGGGWFRIKSPEDYWLRFFNPFSPLGFGLPFSEGVDKEKIEELSNFDFFLPWVASSPELFKFLQERNLLGDLGINPEDCFFVPELGFWIIPVDNGLNMKDYRFFPYTRMMVIEGRINSPPFIPVENYIEWLGEFVKNLLIPGKIKNDLEEVCQTLELFKGKTLVPEFKSGFLMDSWQIEEGGKEPSSEKPPIISPGGIFLALNSFQPIKKPPEILAPSTAVKIEQPRIWGGFTERINPFQIIKVDFQTLREIEGPFGLRIRTPKTLISPFSEKRFASAAAGILVLRPPGTLA